jgi:hypothetical protein
MMASIARGRAVQSLALVAGALLWAFSISPAHSGSSFTLFESGQVRPLALSPDGSHLFAVNTPDNRPRSSGSTSTGSRTSIPSRWALSRSLSRRARTARVGHQSPLG